MEVEKETRFFEEEPGSRSMGRLLAFLISMVPLAIWTLANVVKFYVLLRAEKPEMDSFLIIPMPETILGLVVSGLSLKFLQKRYGENILSKTDEGLLENKNKEG